MFFVIIYSAIDQGYIGFSLASCNKDEIWDLRAELGLTFQGFGPNWDQVPNLGHHYKHCSCYLDFFFSETKFSETETFFRRPKFSETETETFFPKPNFPRPRLFSETKFFRNRNRDFFSKTKFSETETETLKDFAKVSNLRSFETKMSRLSSNPCTKDPRI